MRLFGFNIFRSKLEPPAPRPPLPPLPDDVAKNAAGLLRSLGITQLGELNRKMFRSYDAAITTNYNADFRSTYGSANAELLVSLYVGRARARTLAKDTPHGKAMVRTFQNNVVGRGFRLKMRVGKYQQVPNPANATNPNAPAQKTRFVPEEDTNRQIEKEYKIAGRPENFSIRKSISRMEAFRQMEFEAITAGGCILRHHRAYPFNKYGYAVDLLENDRLQESYMGRSEDGNPIRFSIEYHREYNFPVNYWILTRHPGEPFGYTGNRSEVWREKVPAEDVIHFNNLRDRCEQDIGMTELDAVIQCAHRDRQYNTALCLAAIASCCKPFWIEKLFPTGMQYTAEEFAGWVNQIASNITGPLGTNGTGPTSGAQARQQGIANRTNTEMPASTIEMEWGQRLQQIDPKFPIEAAHEFKADNLREMAVGAGLAYQAVSGDFQNLGFSASRSCELPQRDNFRVRQEHFIEVVVRPHFREWLRSAIMAGVIDQPLSRLDDLVEAAHFQGVRWPFVNPLQDIQATILALEAGLVSPQQIQDELEDGISIEDLYALLAEAKELQEAHGLDFSDNDPTKPSLQSGEPGQVEPAADGQPPAKNRPANPLRKRSMNATTQALLAMQRTA